MREFTIGKLNGRFVVSWRADGKRRRFRLEARSAADAEREAIDVYRAQNERPAGHTIGDLWELYRDEKKGRRVAAAMASEWKFMAPTFGHLRPDQIEIEHSRQHAAVRRERGVKDGTLWTELGHLSTVLKWAFDRKMISHRPVIERPSKPAPKDRFLTTAEVQALLAVPMAFHIRIAVLLMLGTAARPGAAQDLTWDRVDFDLNVIDLRTGEGNRKGRAVIPMNRGLRAALLEAKQVRLSDYVIEWSGQPVKSIKTGLNRACAAAGLEGVSPHVFRHTAAVHLAVAGVAMSKIAQYLGHSDDKITQRVYAKFSPDHMREEAAVLDFASPSEVPGRFNEPERIPSKIR